MIERTGLDDVQLLESHGWKRSRIGNHAGSEQWEHAEHPDIWWVRSAALHQLQRDIQDVPVIRAWPISGIPDDRIRNWHVHNPASVDATLQTAWELTAERMLAILRLENPGYTIDISAEPPEWISR